MIIERKKGTKHGLARTTLYSPVLWCMVYVPRGTKNYSQPQAMVRQPQVTAHQLQIWCEAFEGKSFRELDSSIKLSTVKYLLSKRKASRPAVFGRVHWCSIYKVLPTTLQYRLLKREQVRQVRVEAL